MGRGGDALGGPDYGAKALLAVFQVGTIATGATSTVIGKVTVPSTEDWYITDWAAFCTAQGSAAGVLTLVAASAAVQAGKTLTLVTNDQIAATFTPDSGEDEGTKVAGGVALTVQAATGNTTAVSEVTVQVSGYRRYPAGGKAI